MIKYAYNLLLVLPLLLACKPKDAIGPDPKKLIGQPKEMVQTDATGTSTRLVWVYDTAAKATGIQFFAGTATKPTAEHVWVFKEGKVVGIATTANGVKAGDYTLEYLPSEQLKNFKFTESNGTVNSSAFSFSTAGQAIELAISRKIATASTGSFQSFHAYKWANGNATSFKSSGLNNFFEEELFYYGQYFKNPVAKFMVNLPHILPQLPEQISTILPQQSTKAIGGEFYQYEFRANGTDQLTSYTKKEDKDLKGNWKNVETWEVTYW